MSEFFPPQERKAYTDKIGILERQLVLVHGALVQLIEGANQLELDANLRCAGLDQAKMILSDIWPAHG